MPTSNDSLGELSSNENLEIPIKPLHKSKNLFNNIISLLNKNPNYKMLGLLILMLINFSVFVEIANWLKNSELAS
mgnify:FL=1